MAAATVVLPLHEASIEAPDTRAGVPYVVNGLVAGQSKMAHTPPNPRRLASSNRNVN